jgi:hypothetical protein
MSLKTTLIGKKPSVPMLAGKAKGTYNFLIFFTIFLFYYYILFNWGNALCTRAKGGFIMTKTIQSHSILFLDRTNEETQDNINLILSVLDSLYELQKSIKKLEYLTEKILLETGAIRHGWRNINQNEKWK